MTHTYVRRKCIHICTNVINMRLAVSFSLSHAFAFIIQTQSKLILIKSSKSERLKSICFNSVTFQGSRCGRGSCDGYMYDKQDDVKLF